MSLWQFLLRAVWREADMVTRAVQTVTVTLLALMAIAVGVFGFEWTKDLWPAWVWLAITAAAAVGSVFFGVTKRALKLEREREPKVVIGDIKDDWTNWEDGLGHHATYHHYYLSITNTSLENIKNCSIRDILLVDRDGNESQIKNRFLRLKSEREAGANHTFTREFDLRGKGDRVEIDICQMDESKSDTGIVMSYATTPTQIHANLISRNHFPQELTIQVTADNLPVPITKKIKIFVNESGSLRVE